MKSIIIKRRLVKAKSALNQTVQKILDISRKKKTIPFSENPEVKEAGISEELWLLNKLVKQQAQLVRHYETTLTKDNFPNTNGLLR